MLVAVDGAREGLREPAELRLDPRALGVDVRFVVRPPVDRDEDPQHAAEDQAQLGPQREADTPDDALGGGFAGLAHRLGQHSRLGFVMRSPTGDGSV